MTCKRWVDMNILLTSAGRRSYIIQYFREALAGLGSVHAANSVYSSALQAADRAVLTPLIYDSSYIDFLIDYCKRNEIGALLSLFDIDLPILAQSKARFMQQGVQVVVSDYDVTQICNDKWLTFQWLNENGMNTPKTFLKIENIEKELDDKKLSFPIIIKPRWGMGSLAIHEADNKEELVVLYKTSKRQIFDSYLSFESKLDREHCVVFQEKLSGQEYGLDVVNDLKQNYVSTFIKKKISMRTGETDSAVTEYNPHLESLGRYISEKLQHVANLDVDCFMVDDVPYVLEMNCRFGGHYPFSHLAGADLPLAIVKWLSNETPDKKLFQIHYNVQGIKDINPIILRDKNI